MGFSAVEALPDASAVAVVTIRFAEREDGPRHVTWSLLRWDVGGEERTLADDVRAVAW